MYVVWKKFSDVSEEQTVPIFGFDGGRLTFVRNVVNYLITRRHIPKNSSGIRFSASNILLSTDVETGNIHMLSQCVFTNQSSN
jgi:hypothetical protein